MSAASLLAASFGVAAVITVVGVLVGRVVRVATPALAQVRGDGVPFSWPWVELAAGGAFLAVALAFGVDSAAAKWYLFALLLLAITATDFFCKLIPDRLTYPGAVAGLLLSFLTPGDIASFLNHPRLLGLIGLEPNALGGLVLSLVGAAVGFGLFEGFRRLMSALAGMEVMGMGDSKLLMLVGAFLGPSMVLLGLVPGLACGILLGVPYTKIAKTPHLPFGPALALGAFLTLFLGDGILAAWVGFGDWTRSLPPNLMRLFALTLLGVAIGLMIRVRKRRAEYSRQIEEEYDRLDDERDDERD